MSERNIQAEIKAAQAYEDLFVPALFREWAHKVCHFAGLEAGQRVLDVACGTGILARTAAEQIDSPARITGVDIGPGMLAVAQKIAPHIEWREGSAEALPFSDQSFDAVLSQFGLMFFGDKKKALREMLRVLSPGGSLTVTVWDSLKNNPAYADEVDLLQRMAGQAAADALRIPFAFHKKEELLQLAIAAGLETAVVNQHVSPARFPDLDVFLEADLRGWLPMMGVNLEEALIQEILKEGQVAMSAYIDEDGAVLFPTTALVLSGFKPA